MGPNLCHLLDYQERRLVLNRACRPSRQSGFSLIELMVGIAIFGVLLAVGIPALRSYSVNAKVLATGQSLFSGIQRARAEAIRLNTPVQLVLTENAAITNPNITDLSSTGRNWIVRAFNRGTGTYDLVDAKSGAEGGSTGSVTISATDAATNPVNTIEFNGLGGTTLTSVVTFAFAPADGACTTASTPTEYRCINIIVTPGGRAQLCDPAATAATDSRRCIVV